MFNHILRNTTGTYLVIDSGKQYLKTKQIQNRSIRKKEGFYDTKSQDKKPDS